MDVNTIAYKQLADQRVRREIDYRYTYDLAAAPVAAGLFTASA